MGLVQCLCSVIPGGVGGLVAARICARHGVSREGTWLGSVLPRRAFWCLHSITGVLRRARSAGWHRCTAKWRSRRSTSDRDALDGSREMAPIAARVPSRGLWWCDSAVRSCKKGKVAGREAASFAWRRRARVCSGWRRRPCVVARIRYRAFGHNQALVRARADVNAAAEVRWDATGTRALQTALYSACSSKLQAPRSVGSGIL